MLPIRCGGPVRRAGREAGASEVIGGVLLLTVTIATFILLSSALFQQARDTAAYIRSLVPEEPGLDGASSCIAFPQGTWCRRLPREEEPGERCVRDSLGWQWCRLAEGLPGLPEAGGGR